MKVENVTLFNFCQFSNLSWDLTEGTTRIYAPNGAGKTNFFRGLVYALTGWCDPSWGTQSDLQKDDASSPGYAQVTLNISGAVYTLRRYVITSPKMGDTLDCPELNLHIEKRQRVNQYLESKLPISLVIMAQLMWLRQSSLSWLLTATPASINVFLGLIFDVKPLEKLRNTLKMICSQIADIRGDQDERIAYWQGVLDQVPDIQGLEKELSDLEEKYAQLASYTGKTILRKSDQEKQAKDLQEKLDGQNQKITKLKTEIEEASSILPSTIPDLTKLRESLRAEKEKVDDLVLNIKNYREKIDADERVLKALLSAASGVCEYCGSTFESTDDHKQAVLSRLGIQDTPYEQAVSSIKKSLEVLEANLKHKEKELEKTKVEQLEASVEQAVDINTVKAYLREKKAELLKEQQEAANIQVAKTFVDEAVVISDDEQPIQEQLEACKDALTTVRQCLQDAKTNKAMADKSLEQLQQEKEDHERNSYVKNLFSIARDVLSQSRAQSRYINGKLDTINSYIEHYLALSEMPFVLKLDKKEHQFRFHMVGNETEHPAGMLSGAQQAAAAIAVQMALVETAFPELSLLLVDEADAALSPENKFIAARLYRTLSESINGTVLVISQAEEVTADCDNTWELGK